MSGERLYLIGYRDRNYWFDGRRQRLGIESPIQFYKIGVAKNPEERLGNMKPSTPHELELVTTVETDDAYSVEENLHEYYCEWRVKGEWFKLPLNAVNSLRGLEMISAENMKKCLKQKYSTRYDRYRSFYITLHEVRTSKELAKGVS